MKIIHGYIPMPTNRLLKRLIRFLSITAFLLALSCTKGGYKDPPANNNTPPPTTSQIDTVVDPQFVYNYEKTKFIPPAGKTLLIMGQTMEDIADYMGSFSDEPLPGGWSAYWGIPSIEGITSTYFNPNGSSQNHQYLVDSFPNSVIQSACWMVGTWDVAKNTANGDNDHVIRHFSTWAKSVDRPIYLRIGYEFDGPHNELDPVDYVNAYHRVVDIMRAEGVTNVAFVWHSYLFAPYNGNTLESYYPGDDYVDWAGISLFGLLYQDADLLQYGDAFMEFAKLHKKPVMVAEASPTNGIYPNDITVWNTWFVNFFSVCYQKNIKAISFINANWTDYNFPGINWADARLTNNTYVSDSWFAETNKPRYLKQSPTLFHELGYQ